MNEKQVLKHTVSYDEGLLKALKDPKEARAYLEVALDECEASLLQSRCERRCCGMQQYLSIRFQCVVLETPWAIVRPLHQ